MGQGQSGTALRAFLAAAAATAIAIGLLLPTGHASQAAQPTKSQFVMLDLGS